MIGLLDCSALRPEVQERLINSLGGKFLSFKLCRFDDASRNLLKNAGLTPTDINELEDKNILLNDGSYPVPTQTTEQVSIDAMVNPWKQESFNLTDQILITKEHPELAERLKNAA